MPRYSTPIQRIRGYYRTSYSIREHKLHYDAHAFAERTTGSHKHDRRNIYYFKYLTSHSNDDVAIYFRDDTYIVAFRGTDYEPLRYLGYLPADYRDRFIDNRRMYPIEPNREAYGCIDDIEPDYEGAITETSKHFCNFEPFTTQLVQNCIQEHHDFDRWDSELYGGEQHCTLISDCRANKFISRAVINPYANKNLDTEPKHVHAFSTLKKLFLDRRPGKILITGHSLGGSLAIYSLQQLLLNGAFQAETRRNPISVQAIVFNSAPTNITVKLPEYILPNVLHIRNLNDVVSYKRDKSIETWNFKNYKDQNPGYYLGSAQRQFHGLDQFFCKGDRAPYLTNHYTYFQFMTL